MGSLKNANRIAFLVSTIVVFISCNLSETKQITFPKATTISVDTASYRYTTNIDTLIDNIRFIRLESGSENIVGEVTKVEFLGNSIVVLDRKVSNAVFIFDQNGRLVKKLKSPNNNHISDFTILKGNIVLFLDFSNDIVIFNDKGELINKQHSSKKLYSSSIASAHGDTYLFWNNVVSSSIGSFRLIEYDFRSQRFVNGLLPFDPALASVGNTFNPTPFNKIDDSRILVSQPLDDTIYTLDVAFEKAQLYPSYILSFQNKPLPKSFNNTVSHKVKLEEAYKNGYSFYLSHFSDLTSVILFSYYANSSYMTYIWDKKTRKSVCNSLDVMIEKMNLKLPQKLLQVGKNKLIGAYPAYEIHSWGKKQPNKKINVLSQIANEISPIDNPILVILDFKK